MPNTREKQKLIELLSYFGDCYIAENRHIVCDTKICEIVDHLIANDVMVREWISVDERKPDLIPCGAGTAYSEAVNVLTDGRKVLTAIWNGSYWICDAEFWDAEFEEITHWTPVLLPLPKPPKGE